MGSGVRAVWSTNGQSETVWMRVAAGKPTESRVFLDYSPISALKPPFGGQAVDEVIGYAAHEGGHCLWSDVDSPGIVRSLMSKRQSRTTQAAASDPKKVQEALRIANILEDAYIDYHVGEEWPVLGEYIRWARQKIAGRRPIDMAAIARTPQPSRNAIMNLWIACSLYDHDLPAKMSARVRRAMTFLMSKSVQAVKEPKEDWRLVLAVDCWEYLTKEFPVADAPLPRQQPPPQPPQPQPKPVEPEGGEAQGAGVVNGGATATAQA